MSKFNVGEIVRMTSSSGLLALDVKVWSVVETVNGTSYDVVPIDGGSLQNVPEKLLRQK